MQTTQSYFGVVSFRKYFILRVPHATTTSNGVIFTSQSKPDQQKNKYSSISGQQLADSKSSVTGIKSSEQTKTEELSSARSRLKTGDSKPVHTSSVTVQVKGTPQSQSTFKPVEINVAIPAQAAVKLQSTQLQTGAQVSKFEPVTSRASYSPGSQNSQAAVVTSVTPGSKAAAVALLSNRLQVAQAKVGTYLVDSLF